MNSATDEAMDVDPAEEAEEEVPAVIKVRGAKIGDNFICNLNVEVEGSKKKKVSTSNRVAVLILDCSGSMGHWVQRSINAWQRALRAQKYGENDEVHTIEFESNTVHNQHKLKDLNSLNMHCRGGTTMSGVVSKLDILLTKHSDKTINIWVVSDGQIGDQANFKQTMTKTLANRLNSPNINVVGVRLCSGYSDPDVQAMSAVGLLSTQQFNLENFQMENEHFGYHHVDNNTESPQVKDLAEVLGGMRAPEEKIVVEMGDAKLMVRPGEDGGKKLELWNGDWFMIKNGDLKEGLMVNEKMVEVELFPETENLTVLEQFATKIYLRLIQEKVAGLYETNVKFVDALENLFFDLDNMSSAAEEAMEASHSEMSTTSRALQIKAKFTKQQKTIRQKIAELRTLGNLEKMSGHMKSDLLRNLGPSKGDMGLMKRFYRTDQGKDPTSMMTEAIVKCKPALLNLKMEKEQEVREECFFSKESSLENALVAIEIGVDVYEESNQVTPDNLLTIFGLHGLAIKHKANNYTDPMLIGLNQGYRNTITDIYTNVCLNQSVLWYAKQNGNEIKAPGFDGTITAVVPIKAWNHPAVWKLYCHDTDIAAMQTSAHLRSTITPLPKDRIAFTASLLLKMMADWAEPTEIQRKMMSDTLNSIQWKNQSDKSKELADILKGEEPLTGLSTAHNLASELAPFAQVLCDPVLLAFLGTPASQKLWRALVANTVYWRVRREIGDHDRTEIIKKLLNYDEAKFTHPLPDNEKEPVAPVIHDMWDEKKAKEYIAKHKYVYDNKLYKTLHTLAKSFQAAGSTTTPEIFKWDPATTAADIGAHTVGMDFDLFCLVEIVKSIETKTETERYGEESIGFHATEDDARNYLKTIVRDLYRRQYDTELKLKLERVKEAKLEEFLKSFKDMKFDDFAIHLHENIPNQNSKGMSEVLETMTKEKENTVDLASKVELLLVGKLGDNMWNNGSVAR